jgi:adenosine deaminase
MNDTNARIVFNIGGRRFETTEATVRRISNTRLTNLLDENAVNGEIFIDRDARNFEHVPVSVFNNMIPNMIHK